MDANFMMARESEYSLRVRGSGEAGDPEGEGPDVLPCPAGEPPAVEAQWNAIASTCRRMTAGDAVILLELSRCLADLEEARKQVEEVGVFVLSKSGDLVENPWADRERKLRGQSMQLRKQLDCLGPVVSLEAAARAEAAELAEAEAKAAADAAARAKAEAEAAKRAAAAEKRRARREAAKAAAAAAS